MAKEKVEDQKKQAPGPMPSGDIHFTRPMSPEEINEINVTLRDLMTKFGINFMTIYWGRFVAPPAPPKSKIHAIN